MFARADKMFHHLKLSIIDGSHDRTLRTYLRPDILIIDELCKVKYYVKSANKIPLYQHFLQVLTSHNKYLYYCFQPGQ